jgi:hypothetical protein
MVYGKIDKAVFAVRFQTDQATGACVDVLIGRKNKGMRGRMDDDVAAVVFDGVLLVVGIHAVVQLVDIDRRDDVAVSDDVFFKLHAHVV